MEQNMNISKENLLKSYNDCSKDIKKVLENLFGKNTFKPKDITEKIKTFEDACNELGKDHRLVRSYKGYVENISEANKDVIAYLKLRVITTALNEGWEPKLVQGERRYYPWFSFYTNKQIKNMNERDRADLCRVVGRASSGANAYGGLVYSGAGVVSAYSGTYCGSRLVFKTKELAEYAGKQFIEIYRDFIIK